MNKSAVAGFVVGLLVLVVAIGGWYVVKGRSNSNIVTRVTQQAPKDAPKDKPKPAPKAAAKPVTPIDPNAAPSSLTLTRAVVPGADGTAEITLTISQKGEDPVRALGIEETLPEGWSFDANVKGEQPDLAPSAARTGKLDFAWFNIPKFPIAFTYRVKSGNGGANGGQIAGHVLFRTSGPELRSDEVVTPLVSGGVPTKTDAPQPTLTPPPAEKPAEKPSDKPADTTAEKPTDQLAEKPMEKPVDKPADAPAAKADAPAGGGDFEGLKLAQSVAKPFTPGGTGEVKVDLAFGKGDPVSAMAVTAKLPQGWTFDKMTGGVAPAVPPPAGASGEITFIWIQVPTFPASFTYAVKTPESAKSSDFISSQVVYRRKSAEERSPENVLELPPASSEAK